MNIFRENETNKVGARTSYNKNETSNNYRSYQMQQENTNSTINLKKDKLTEERVVRDIRQKEPEFELSKVNPEDILDEEEKRTSPLCSEE